MENKDHDLLIKLGSKVDSLCKRFDNLENRIDNLRSVLPCDEHWETCRSNFDKINGKTEKKLSKNATVAVFSTLLVVMVGVFSGIISWNFAQDAARANDIIKNRIAIEKEVVRSTELDNKLEQILQHLLDDDPKQHG